MAGHKHYRRNPSAKAVGLSVGALAVGGAAVWYFFLRKKPTSMIMATPTLAQQATSPSNPMQAAAMSSLATVIKQLQPGLPAMNPLTNQAQNWQPFPTK